jgi:hypothetical protein
MTAIMYYDELVPVKLGELVEISSKLGPDELKVLEIIARRLANGQVTYGLFDVDTDPRDFARETLEEVCDAAVYSAAQLLKLIK